MSVCVCRSTRDSDGEEEEEDERRVSRGCTLQFQRAMVKVLTQFHTTSTEGADQVITMLGSDWQLDVTDLVQDSLKVAEPRVAELVDRTVLVGLELGSTVLKVTFAQSLNRLGNVEGVASSQSDTKVWMCRVFSLCLPQK